LRFVHQSDTTKERDESSSCTQYYHPFPHKQYISSTDSHILIDVLVIVDVYHTRKIVLSGRGLREKPVKEHFGLSVRVKEVLEAALDILGKSVLSAVRRGNFLCLPTCRGIRPERLFQACLNNESALQSSASPDSATLSHLSRGSVIPGTDYERKTASQAIRHRLFLQGVLIICSWLVFIGSTRHSTRSLVTRVRTQLRNWRDVR
jgi:hypothetical protein